MVSDGDQPDLEKKKKKTRSDPKLSAKIENYMKQDVMKSMLLKDKTLIFL